MSDLTVNDFKKGMRVLYMPIHAHGNHHHPDCQAGVVSSCNAMNVFVKYDNRVMIMKTGDENCTSQATDPGDLLILAIKYKRSKIQKCGLCDEFTGRGKGNTLLSIDNEPLCEICFTEEQLK